MIKFLKNYFFKLKAIRSLEETIWKQQKDIDYIQTVFPELEKTIKEESVKCDELKNQIEELKKSHTRADREKRNELVKEYSDMANKIAILENYEVSLKQKVQEKFKKIKGDKKQLEFIKKC